MKDNLRNHDIESKISITAFEKKGRQSSQLMFSNAIGTADEVKLVFKMNSNDNVFVVELIRRTTTKSFINSDKIT